MAALWRHCGGTVAALWRRGGHGGGTRRAAHDPGHRLIPGDAELPRVTARPPYPPRVPQRAAAPVAFAASSSAKRDSHWGMTTSGV